MDYLSVSGALKIFFAFKKVEFVPDLWLLCLCLHLRFFFLNYFAIKE